MTDPASAAPVSSAPATDILRNTLTISSDGADYEFRIPSLFDEMRIGVRMRDIRRRIDPSSDGSDIGLDQTTLYFNRACATFEVMLNKASVEWPFSQGKNGPVVDCEKFPKEKAATVIAVYGELQEKLITFRAEGIAAGQPDSGQALAGGKDNGERTGG